MEIKAYWYDAFLMIPSYGNVLVRISHTNHQDNLSEMVIQETDDLWDILPQTHVKISLLYNSI